MRNAIERLEKYILKNDLNVFDIAGMDDDGIYYKSLRPANSVNNSFSVSKSFTAAVVGAAIDRGLISLNDKVVDFFKGELPDGYDRRWNDVTLEHILIHAYGAEQGYMFQNEVIITDENWNKLIFSKPLKFNAGERMRYSNVGCYLAAQIVAKVFKKPFSDCIRELIFNPLGFKYYGIITDCDGNALAATGMVLRTEDCAKFGYMYAKGGLYGDKRILSEDWVRLAATTRIRESDGRGYTLGCMWRLDNEPSYFADGAYGQMIFIDPVKKYSVAVHSYTDTPVRALVTEILKKG